MKVEDMTVGDAMAVAKMFGGAQAAQPAHPWNVGGNYFIRTVTHHLTGRLVAVHAQELVLEDACWIADDGRFSEALKTCEFNEVEPFPAGRRVIVGRGSLIDATEVDNINLSQK